MIGYLWDSLNTRTTSDFNCANFISNHFKRILPTGSTVIIPEDSQNNKGGTHIETIPMENIPNGEYHGE